MVLMAIGMVLVWTSLRDKVIEMFNRRFMINKKDDAEEAPENGYLTFSSTDSFTLNVYDNAKHWDGTLEYSTNKKNWNVWNGTSISSGNNNELYLRGTGNSVITGRDSGEYKWILTPSSSNKIRCIGNIENLLDYRTVLNGEHPVMGDICYAYMFFDCRSLVQSPELPATELASICYSFMFKGCEALTQIPELPATNLTSDCYSGMFDGCTSLKFSTTKTAECPNEYRIPYSGTGTTASNALFYMFFRTSGTFTGDPSINTTYYTNATVV